MSVFSDNAGIIRFDDKWNVSFKVETHNHPSAIEPYGGSNTGIGGVIRDILGAGMGGKPICNTDVFCVASPEMSHESLPQGTLHPARVLKGVVAGVRDYGNRMGIPTLNGAVYFDDRYIGNPLVFCGCIGLMPRNKIKGAAKPGDRIVIYNGNKDLVGAHAVIFMGWAAGGRMQVVQGGGGGSGQEKSRARGGTWCVKSECGDKMIPLISAWSPD